MTVVLELAVGDSPDQVTVTDAERLVVAARDAGVTAIRLVDRGPGHPPTHDPSTVGAYLAGAYGGIGYIVDAPTTGNAPFNLARRILSFHRATGGFVGLALRPGAGDEVTGEVGSDGGGADSDSASARRWSEYAGVLTGLWESFPVQALLGDQDAAIVADDALIQPIDHVGEFYSVAGPLDGPSSPQGRPVLVAADVPTLHWDRPAAIADAVIVDHTEIDGADVALSAALDRIGRHRREVALLARLDVDDADPLLQALASTTVDGVVLVHRDRPEDTIAVLRNIVTRIGRETPRHLRQALGLRVPDEAPGLPRHEEVLR